MADAVEKVEEKLHGYVCRSCCKSSLFSSFLSMEIFIRDDDLDRGEKLPSIADISSDDFDEPPAKKRQVSLTVHKSSRVEGEDDGGAQRPQPSRRGRADRGRGRGRNRGKGSN